MKISAMHYSFRQALESGELDTAAMIRYLKQLDVSAVELSEPFVRDRDLDAIQTALSETGTEVVSYVTYCDFINSDPMARQSQVTRVRKSLARAAVLGASQLMVFPGTLEGDISPEVARNWISEGLKDCLSDASRLQITLTIENLGSQTIVYGRSDHLQAICDSVGPELKVTYDVGNFFLAAEDSLQALDRLAPRVEHVHFKDWQVLPVRGELPEHVLSGADGRYYEGAVLGQGVVDLKGPVRRLRELNYDGDLSVEYEGIGEPKEAVSRSVKYLRSLLEGSV